MTKFGCVSSLVTGINAKGITLIQSLLYNLYDINIINKTHIVGMEQHINGLTTALMETPLRQIMFMSMVKLLAMKIDQWQLVEKMS